MYPRTQNSIRGVTLVELMLAVAITAILLIGVGTIYGNAKRTYTVDEEFARLQENARIAMRFLIEDIRTAGYLGCMKNVINPLTNQAKHRCLLNAGSYACQGAAALLTTGLEGYDAAGSTPNNTITAGSTAGWSNNTFAAPPTQLTTARTPYNGSDIIILRRGDSRGGRLVFDKSDTDIRIFDQGQSVAANAGTSPADCHTPSNVCEEDILVLSDCQKAVVFQATELQNDAANSAIIVTHANTTTPGNNATLWGGLPTETASENRFLRSDAHLMKLHTSAYFVALDNNGVPSLYRHNGLAGSAADQLVEGVESMQILYGVDSDNDNIADRYEAANTINFTTAVIVSVRISLLMRSKDNIPARPAAAGAFNLAETTVTTGSDQRLRRIFTTTIKLRDKGIS